MLALKTALSKLNSFAGATWRIRDFSMIATDSVRIKFKEQMC